MKISNVTPIYEIMKTKFFFFLVLFVSASTITAQPKLSVEEWRADLKYLQDKVNQEYSPLLKKVTREEFNETVQELNRKIPSMETHEIIVGFAKLIAMFKYGHTTMPLFSKGHDHGAKINTGFKLIPINFYSFNNGTFVQAVRKDYQLAAGARVMGVGSKTSTLR